ncbi:periplasmic binding protein-like II [Neocallimastix californiae]|uniref:Periplasmic binding protein-like II n=1 Tax=Neocallimastix californiae TaxID=1754190 RepID=A0A1Y2AED6_9FUNG|nr:periplasmic binding protein-like II [Neocallimastix californiae]|eukprot:ORY20943.1 periplasmic binding protein-like II [Neocallimastix californiae]
MILQIIILVLLLSKIGNTEKQIVINGIANTCYSDDVYSKYTKEFNNYSKKNNLNIVLNINTFTKENSTVVVNQYESVLEFLFKKKSTKYELYFYDNIFTSKYGPYLLKLDDWVSKEQIDMYKDLVPAKTCIYKGKWVSFPIKTDISVLYYNDKYLNKYNKSVPKTWNELLETAKYIYDKEKELNNTEFIAYNGLFSYTELGMCSLYEFIYSYRDSLNSSFPDIQSPQVVEALKMIKKLKDTISSDEIFQKVEEFSEEYFSSGNFLFQKFWYYPWFNYNFTILPGNHENISGSALGGYNLGINKYINDEKKNAALTVFKFLTSYEMQRKLLHKYKYLTSIPKVYEDEEVCANFNCDPLRRVQIIERPTNKTNNYSIYSEKFRNYIYEYVYGNKKVNEVLEKVNNLTKIHIFSINPKDNLLGLVTFIIVMICLIAMLLSISLLYIQKFKPFFCFLSNDYWIIFVLGSCIIISSSITEIGYLYVYKCHLKIILLCIGYTMNIVPLLYKLVINFPEENKISILILNHRYIFLMCFIFLDIVINGLNFITPYQITSNTIVNEKKYYVCEMRHNFGKAIQNILIIYKILIAFIIILLIFIEWNMSNLHKDIKFFVSVISMDIAFFIILISLQINNIKKKDYLAYRYILTFTTIILSVTNYVFIYGLNIIRPFIKLENEELSFHNAQKQQNNKSEQSCSLSIKSPLDSSSRSSTNFHSIVQKLTEYHYRSESNSSGSLSSFSDNFNKNIDF